MTTATILVPEIHCEHCKASVEGALVPVRGVCSAAVGIPSRRVTVTYDEAAVDRLALVRAIEEQGYEVPDR